MVVGSSSTTVTHPEMFTLLLAFSFAIISCMLSVDSVSSFSSSVILVKSNVISFLLGSSDLTVLFFYSCALRLDWCIDWVLCDSYLFSQVMRIPTWTSCGNVYLGKNTQPSLICLLVEEWHQNSHCLLGSSSWGTNYADSKSEVQLKKKIRKEQL